MKPALFLDRDGVVNEDTDFVHKPEDFVFRPGIFALIRTAHTLGYEPVIITNQSGIARGLFTEDDFFALTYWMLAELTANDAAVTAVYHCPFFPGAKVAAYEHPNHPWRKPAPGMLFAARDEFGLDLAKSALVGDRWSDAIAGSRAGLTRLALVSDRPDREGRPKEAPAVDRLEDVEAAVAWLRAVAGR